MANGTKGKHMNCRLVWQRLLGTSGPRRIPAAVEAHLTECNRCRQLSRDLARIDAAISQIPLPSSSAAKSAFIERFLSPATPRERSTSRPTPTRKWSIAVTSAVVILFVIGVFAWHRRTTPPAGPASDPMLEQLVGLHAELAATNSMDRRVEILARIASALDEQARSLALVADVDDLQTLAQLFADVLGEKGLGGKAELVPPLNRKALLEPIAADLLRMAAAYEEISRRVPPNRIGAFREMARVAREAREVLRRKLQEEDVAGLQTQPANQGGKS